MSAKDRKSEERFIELYRLKVQRELDAMGYPGGKDEETAVEGRVIDAGEEVRLRLEKEDGSKKRDVVPGQ